MINLFLGSLSAALLCFFGALLTAALRMKEPAVRLGLLGFLFLLVACAVWIVTAWWVAYA